jgi:YbbR domain-containing protein
VKVAKAGTNLTAKIVSFLFALVLWLVVSLNAPFTYKVNVPIKYLGPSEGYIVTGSYPDKVLLLIQGTGKELLSFSLKQMFNPAEFYALVSLSGLTKGKHQVELDKSKINVSGDGSLEVESILDKTYFSIEIDRMITRNIPVNTDSLPDFQVDKGYVIVGKPVVKPQFIVIQGPEDTLNTMRSVRIASLDRNRISVKDSTVKATLRNDYINLVTIDPEIVDISFNFEPLAQKVFVNIPLTLKSFPRKNLPQFIPDSFTVDVKGPESIISKLKPDDILVTIQYQKFLEQRAQGEQVIRPEVKFPEGVNVSLTPEIVRFTIKSVRG